jgi:hypothetical protein
MLKIINKNIIFFSYEKANTHHSDVPRMLCDEPKVLEFYTKKKAEQLVFFFNFKLIIKKIFFFFEF